MIGVQERNRILYVCDGGGSGLDLISLLGGLEKERSGGERVEDPKI